jgi:hypothetical protein
MVAGAMMLLILPTVVTNVMAIALIVIIRLNRINRNTHPKN